MYRSYFGSNHLGSKLCGHCVGTVLIALGRVDNGAQALNA